MSDENGTGQIAGLATTVTGALKSAGGGTGRRDGLGLARREVVHGHEVGSGRRHGRRGVEGRLKEARLRSASRRYATAATVEPAASGRLNPRRLSARQSLGSGGPSTELLNTVFQFARPIA